MSHFSLLVITPTRPSEEDLHKILLPWHEYECTGFEDYVVDVDVTDEMVEDHKKYGNGKPFGADWVRDWSGAVERNGRYYKHTNPNARWDWYKVGGRWTGMLVPKYDPAQDPRNKKVCDLCGGTGKRQDRPEQDRCNGCNGTGAMLVWSTQWAKNDADQVQVRDLPLAALRDEAERRALVRYDRAMRIIAGRPIPEWRAMIEGISLDKIDEMRERYRNDPVVRDLKEGFDDPFLGDIDTFRMDRFAVAVRARNEAVSSFAVVYDGQWYEKGKMGWWGVVRDEKDADRWNEEFSALLDKVSPEAWLTVVDCHI